MSAAIVKFVTSGFHDGIKELEVERETKQCVWIFVGAGKNKDGSRASRRAAKMDQCDQYHSTWLDAHTFLLVRAETNVAACRRSLERANDRLGNIKGMKPPKDAQ